MVGRIREVRTSSSEGRGSRRDRWLPITFRCFLDVRWDSTFSSPSEKQGHNDTNYNQWHNGSHDAYVWPRAKALSVMKEYRSRMTVKLTADDGSSVTLIVGTVIVDIGTTPRLGRV